MRRALLGITLLIFGIHIAASFFFWYHFHPWLDIPMHLLGGLWLAFLTAYIIKKFGLRMPSPFKLVAIVFILGLIWEFYEYGAYAILPRFVDIFEWHGLDIKDTLLDLVNDLLGAAIGAVIIKRNSIPEER